MSGGGLQTKEGGGTDWNWYTNPTGAPAAPGAMPDPAGAPTTYYDSLAPYSGPTYGLTPQSGYTSLAQQLQQAMSLTPQGSAQPRTSLLPMYASPWSKLYGGPATPTFGDMWGQPPGMGTEPPPGTPGYTPPTTTPPVQPPPPPGGASGGSSSGQYPPGTVPPTGTTDPITRPGTLPGTLPGTPPRTLPGTLPGSAPGGGLLGSKAAGAPAGGPLDYVQQRNDFNMNLPYTGPEGMDLRQVLFPNGTPQKRTHGGSPIGKAAGAPGGGPLDYIQQRNNFNMNLPFTGPEGMDLRQVLFPHGSPKRGRGV